MTAGDHRTPECLSPGVLAEYIDGSMDAGARARVEAHLADCEECYEAFVETVRVAQELTAEAASGTVVTIRRPAWRSTRTLAVAAAMAAAAILAVWVNARWFSPDAQLEGALARLATGMGSSRPAVARMTLASAWAPAPATTRGAAALPVPAREAALAIERLAGDAASASHLDALGIAALVSGDIDRSIEVLRRGAGVAPTNASIRTNLSAALFQRWVREATTEDLSAALDASEVALRAAPGSPAASFNKALALEALGLKAEAIDAWRAYLAVETDPAWLREAQAHLDALIKAAQAFGDQIDQVKTGSAAALAGLAATRPTLLYNYLEDVLADWSTRPETDLGQGLATADALTAAGRDAAVPALVRLAHDSAAWPGERRTQLVETVAKRAATIKFIDAALYSEADGAIRAARLAQARAGAPGLELEMLQEQIRYYTHRDVAAVQRLAALEPAARDARYWRILARALQMQGVQLARDGRFADAGVQYERGREVADVAGDQDVRASLFAVTGEIFTLQGQPADAWKFAQLALTALPEVRSYRRRHAVLSLAAVTAEQSGLAGTTLILSTGLLQLADEFGNPAGAAVAQLRRARAFALLGDARSAVDAIDAARTATATIKDPSLRTGYVGDLAWNEGFVLRQSDPRRAIAALDVALATFEETGNSGRAAEALLARGEAKLNLARSAEAEKDWLRGVEVFEDQRPGIRDSQLRVSRLSRVWGLFGSLVALRRDRPADALDILERSRARSLLDALGRKRSIAPMQEPALRSWLPPGVTALAYSVHADRLLVFVITSERVRILDRAVTAAELSALVSGYVRAIRERTVSSDGAQLSAMLVPSDVALRPETPLLLLPDGPLHGLPFATLPVGNQGQLLVQQSEPIIVPSLTVAAQLSSVPWSVPRSALVIAPDAGAASGLPVLRGAKAEAEGLARLYPVFRQLVGSGITSATALDEMSRSQVIHFAGHAITNDRYPSQSRLVVEGGPAQAGLTPADLAESHLPRGALAILAACDTARGAVIQGEGALTLSRALLAGGASSVVGTLWELDDTAASGFLVTFHQELLAGQRPATALARAQRAAIARGQQDVWPAFAIIGSLHKGA